MEEPQKQAYVERARALKSQFLETNPDYVYTRRPNNTKKKYRRRSTGEGDVGSPKLKRPMNAYLLFNKEMRHKLLETNPNMSVAEISKEIGDRWKNLNEEERNRYFTEAQTIKRDFLVTNPDFVYTRRSKAEIEARKKRGMEEEDAALTRDPRGRKKKKQKNPTAPKHPMSGFLFYLAAVRPQVAEQYPGSTVGPISKIIASQWNSMSPEKRLPWEQKASEDKARYAREMEEYLADRQ
ncbi:HMG-box [Basidiobolus meristosporus CBS 931.73]|uniref:HMG-box n=1 Tax=Basidiobolus meristosporus CBS 931.73 TaxID=1314790 RepID=A0A1Y1XFB7_9FUNG|nr:HMG-box [Basidiobolus meristosporus CBS 931.73]|eukprot:ORX84413.1 HMG-box [Basidiobolus meristosporus CBS 931.73]